MASLLNMLNNFLGSAGKSSLFNVDSSNTTQNTDFKDIVSNLLNGAEVDQQTGSGLLLGSTDGVDLPLPAANGNGLPPLLATAAAGIEASLQLLDASATGELAANSLAEEGELLALQSPGALGASASAVPQPTPPASSLELPVATQLETPINATVPETAQLSGADLQLNGTRNPGVENTSTTGLATSAAGSIVRLAEAGANATRPVKLDSIQQGAEQSVANTLNAGPQPANATSLEPAPVVSVPASGATEVSLAAPQAPTALPVDARPQIAAANDAITPSNSSTNASTTVSAAQTPSQSAQVVDLNSTVPAPITAKDPQQLLVEQALGNSTTSDNDSPAEVTRQSILPTSPPLRPAPTAQAPLQTTDANFANVASMLNQGQSMNSLNERLQFMLLNGQNSAEIQLDPPELGSLQVRVTTRHEQTSVIFVAPNNVVRDALEQQLPRLREALEGAGLQLQDANVFAQTEDKPGTQPQSYADAEAADSLLAEELDDGDSSATAARVSMQLVDAYI